MSYDIGWQALNLEMPERVGHTEYCSHPLLVRAVTGMDPREDSCAWREFYDSIGLDLIWNANDGPTWRGRVTSMGHAEFQEGGVDFDPNVYCPFQAVDEVLSLDPIAEIGVPDIKERAAYFQEAYLAGQAAYPGQIFTAGYYKTLFSACIHVFGWEMFLSSAASDPEQFDRVLEGFYEISAANYKAWAHTTAPVFICHDDIVWTQGAVFHPNWYRKYIFPRYRKLWSTLKQAGKKVLFCSDGDFTEFVDDIADAGADGFIFEPLTDLHYIVERYGSTKVIIGNVDTRVLTFGDKNDIRCEVERCMNLGKRCPGYFIAVGNHIPHNVPIDNALYYIDLVHELGQR
ncbi:MAG: uroporphyrinogen decarboxylase family protein [Armatimonadota bacterium]